MFYINRKKTKLLIVVSIETTSTDYILYAIEQRQNKPLDFSLCYQRILTLEYLLFYFSEKREEKKKKDLHSNSRFSKPVILTLQWHHELWLFMIISFISFFFHIHQWNTNLRSTASFNRFVKRIPLSPHKRKGFVAYFNLYA